MVNHRLESIQTKTSFHENTIHNRRLPDPNTISINPDYFYLCLKIPHTSILSKCRLYTEKIRHQL